MKIGIIGGTGNLGAALGGRWARAGHSVFIGSRSAESAAKAADELRGRLGGDIVGTTNLDAAYNAEVVVSCVPFAAQEERLKEIAAAVRGKIFVDCTAPLVPPKVMRVQLPAEGSAAQRAERLLGEGVRVTSAFQTVAAHKLATGAEIAGDVLVFGDDKAARQVVVGLAKDAGLRGLHAGGLPNSAAAEALTSVLIFINKTYQVDGAGLSIIGELVEPSEA